jgi:imidazolonepropionase-like amidohydrolase
MLQFRTKGNFGDYAIGLELLARAGLFPQELIVISTNRSAEALGLSNVGFVRPGFSADLIY